MNDVWFCSFVVLLAFVIGIIVGATNMKTNWEHEVVDRGYANFVVSTDGKEVVMQWVTDSEWDMVTK
jgi:hypothetical protein